MTGRHLAVVPEDPKRAVLYVRVSALMGRGGSDFHSPEIQIGGMRRVTAAMTEVEIVDDDIDRTGRDFEREGIARIRLLAEAGLIDTLAVYNISRFGRNTLEGLQFLNWLAERGVQIISATEHIDTSTPSGRWMLTNYLAMAEMRSDEIGAEWSHIIDKRARDGKGHGRVPVGYTRGEDGRFVPDPVLGPAVTAAFEDYARGKRTVRAVRQDLQKATGLKMGQTAFKSILRNRAYLGEVRVGEIVKTGAHPALVDAALFRRVQARGKVQRERAPRLHEPQYPLSGLVRCGLCGGRSGHHRRSENGQPVARLGCRASLREGTCRGFGAPDAAKVTEAVLELTKVWAAELRANPAASATAAATSRRQAARAVSAEITELRKAMARTTEAWARGRIPDHAYEATMDSLAQEEADLAATLESLQQEAERPARQDRVAVAERLLRLWPRMTNAQRNRALGDLIEYVLVLRHERWRQPVAERITVEWR